MTSINAFSGLMKQTVQIAPWTGADTFGNASYGAAVTYKCRLVGKRRHVLTAAGQQVVSNMTVYLGKNAVIGPRDQVTLSTGDVGSTEPRALNPPIVDVGRFPDRTGWHHSALYLVLCLAVMRMVG